VTMPSGIRIVDTLIGFAHPSAEGAYAMVHRQTRDPERLESPIEFLFKDVPDKRMRDVSDRIGATVDEMDRWGIEKGMVSVASAGDDGDVALRRFPDRFVPCANVDPNDPRAGAELRKVAETWGVRAATVFPAGTSPPVAINDARMYTVYATCVELALPLFSTAGVPGPRLPLGPQHVELIDEVMYDFPDLVFVIRHGAEPWADLAVKLMLKWPGLHYSTSGFAPRYYPRAVIDFVNTRGADKFVYAGYFPFGLSLERIMTELAQLPLRDEVWPKYLRENAVRILGL
jgi:uncharacterized protein